MNLIPMSGSLSSAPASPVCINQLKRQGIAKTMSAQQMAVQLKRKASICRR